MSAGLIFNAVICFVIGADVRISSGDEDEKAGRTRMHVANEPNRGDEDDRVDDRLNESESAGFSDELEDRNRRARPPLLHTMFGIHDFLSGDMSSESFPTTFRTSFRQKGAKQGRRLSMDERQGSGMDMRTVTPPAKVKGNVNALVE